MSARPFAKGLSVDIDLINAALIPLGVAPMSDPGRPNGRIENSAVLVHLQVRREVLEGHHWTACDKVGEVTAEAGGLVPQGYAYVGLLPNDCLGIWSVGGAETFTIVVVGEGDAARRRLAWTGDRRVIVRYSADIPYRLMNPLLQRACADRLGARLRPIQTEDARDREGHENLALSSEMKCASRDALNRREAPLFRSRWDQVNAGAGDPSRGGSW